MTGSKSDRTEWCHVNYESCYNPDRALELQIEWLVATPSLLLEMVRIIMGLRGASKPVIAGIQFYLSPMLYSVKIKVVDETMGTKGAHFLWSTSSLN